MTKPVTSSLTRKRAAVAAIGVAGVSNAVTNLWLPARLYVPWNIGMAGALVVLARSTGASSGDLGLERHHLARSSRTGVVGAGAVVLGYGIALLAPSQLDLFRDERVRLLRTPTALWHLFVRIPLGTVLPEEVVFRGVLPALLGSRHAPSPQRAVLPSLLFGLWHLLPSLELRRASEAVRRSVGEGAVAAVALGFGLSALAGHALHLLRQRTGHLAAPVLVHLATNMVGLVLARFVRADR